MDGTGRPETALERALRTFRLPDEYRVEVLPDRVNILNTATGKGIAIQPDHYASVAAALIAFGIVDTPEDVETPGQDDSWKAELPRKHTEDRLTLRLASVALDPRRSDHVLGTPEDHPDARIVPAYTVEVDGRHAGHVLVLAERKFVLAVPALTPDRSTHRGFTPALQRLSMLVEHPAVRAEA